MCKDEWVDSRLYEVINSYPDYIFFDLMLYHNTLDDATNIGLVKDNYNNYREDYVSYSDEDKKMIWIKVR